MGNRFEKEPKTDSNPQASRITSIRLELESLNRQKQTGELSPKEFRKIRKPLVNELHNVMRQSGRNPIRTKG